MTATPPRPKRRKRSTPLERAATRTSYAAEAEASATEPDAPPPPPPLDDWPAAWLNRESVRAWASGRRAWLIAWQLSGGWEIDADYNEDGRNEPSTMPLAELVMLMVEAWQLYHATEGLSLAHDDADENPVPDWEVLSREVAVSVSRVRGLSRVRHRRERVRVEKGGTCRRCGAGKSRKDLYCGECTQAVRKEIQKRERGEA
jgi:hypothetical protein